MELTVVIPTFNRWTVLEETLRRLSSQQTEAEFEVIVVDDGSNDSTTGFAESFAGTAAIPIRILSQSNMGPAAARNKGVAAAAGEILLFLGDDIWPRSDLVERHSSFHRRNPDLEIGLLGQVVWADEASPSPLMHWLTSAGIQFAYEYIEDPDSVPSSFFYTANVSLKTSFFRSQNGFDEAFPDAALEDTELALRLAAAGMKLRYDPGAIGEHYHPVDLIGTLDRMSKIGKSARLLVERAPDWTWFPAWHAPPRRDPQTLTKEMVLAISHAGGIRPRRVRHATWWLLCEQAFRTAYSNVPEGSRAGWIERRLVSYAARDRATRTDAPGQRRRNISTVNWRHRSDNRPSAAE
jgi:glycosyltransferase involved in cell wall biosynthesis